MINKGDEESSWAGSWRLRENVNSLDSDVTSGPEDGTTQDRKGYNEPGREPRSGQGRRKSSTHRRRKPGRERGPRSNGPYPFLTELKVYLKDVEHAHAESTLTDMARKLRHIHDVLKELKSKGLVQTTSPRKMGEQEIFAFVAWMNAKDGLRSRPLGEATQKKTLHQLKSFLAHLDNGVIDRMLKKKQLRMPRERNVPRESFEADELAQIMTSLKEAAAKGSMNAFGVFGHALFCGYAGTRLKEVRLAQRGDYLAKFYELTVLHPKGEKSWGDPRIAQICPPGRPFADDFMAMRDRELRKSDILDSKAIPLVPRVIGGRVERWPDSVLHNVKCEVERDRMLQFDFRKLRRTYGQNALDAGTPMDFVSGALGHAHVATTQRSYVRLKSSRVFAEIDRAYANASVNSIPVDCDKARCSK